MAAPFRFSRNLSCGKLNSIFTQCLKPQSLLICNKSNLSPRLSQFATKCGPSQSKTGLSLIIRRPKTTARFAGLFLCGGFAVSQIFRRWSNMKVLAEDTERPMHVPSRQVRVDTDNSGLKLTLYQFQTCPFCCKVRALLDFHGFSYDVIEVNSVTKKQLKWSEYKKVPILIVDGAGEGEKKELALHDSSVIISILESYLFDRSTSINTYNSYYPVHVEKTKGKAKYEFSNKYFVMLQETSNMATTAKEREEERKWRKWTDDHLVHMLSPNAYRTVREAFQAFHYFDEVGEWEKNFTWLERQVIIYLGASVMYVLGMVLKRKYMLKDDVRESLYDSCNEWVKAVGKKRPFMGGNQPNLADLAVYGVLTSIEGCDAFQDALKYSKIKPWYLRTKAAVRMHQGVHPLNAKATPSNIKTNK